MPRVDLFFDVIGVGRVKKYLFSMAFWAVPNRKNLALGHPRARKIGMGFKRVWGVLGLMGSLGRPRARGQGIKRNEETTNEER